MGCFGGGGGMYVVICVVMLLCMYMYVLRTVSDLELDIDYVGGVVVV